MKNTLSLTVDRGHEVSNPKAMMVLIVSRYDGGPPPTHLNITAAGTHDPDIILRHQQVRVLKIGQRGHCLESLKCP